MGFLGILPLGRVAIRTLHHHTSPSLASRQRTQNIVESERGRELVRGGYLNISRSPASSEAGSPYPPPGDAPGPVPREELRPGHLAQRRKVDGSETGAAAKKGARYAGHSAQRGKVDDGEPGTAGKEVIPHARNLA